MVLNTLGVHPQALLYAGVGAGFGLLLTRAESRARAFAFWALTTLAGALLAHIMAAQVGGDGATRNGIALVLGMVFPALRERAMALAPTILDAVLRRLGITTGSDKP
jgi:hypothetical protein